MDKGDELKQMFKRGRRKKVDIPTPKVNSSNKYEVNPSNVYYSKNEAINELDYWNSRISEKIGESYEPSGETTSKAIIFMILSTIPGSIAAGAVFSIGFLITLLLAFLIALIPCFGWIALIIFFIGTIISLYLEGFTSAYVVNIMGMMGKNRNRWISIIISSITSVAGIFIALFIISSVFSLISGNVSNVPYLDILTFKDPTIILVIILSIVTIISAAVSANDEVKNAKFCEECEEYMDTGKSENFDMSQVNNAIYIIENREFRNLSNITVPTVNPLRFFNIKLFHCPYCSDGFLEAFAKVTAKYKDAKKNEEHSESREWKFHSIEISRQDGKIIKSQLKLSIIENQSKWDILKNKLKI